MKKNYTKTLAKEHSARAMAVDLPISTKHSVEICNHIKFKTLEKAKRILNQTIKRKEPIPFKRFKHNVGHRKGNIAAGRYPKKASEHILRLLNQVETNAQDKGLNTDNLLIKHVKADHGTRILHRGVRGRERMKRTHLEIIVEEKETKNKPKTEQKQKEAPKETPKENKK